MSLLPRYTHNPWRETYSEIIDVRSPGEFAQDHIPGAINLPVLNDRERAEVGTIYKQISAFMARKIGAALVSRNISAHITNHFVAKEKDYHPLVYCWRGGQRSASMASVLTQIGWQVTLLEGGYKTYRTYVRRQLESLPDFRFQVLCGLAGSGKTQILRQMRHRGAQVLDLEGLANHRGSLLGEQWQGKLSPQPSQKKFESLLVQELQSFDQSRTVWIESESSKIGRVYLPKSLWQKMQSAKCVEIQVPMAARVQFLLQEYPHLMTHPQILKAKLERLKSSCGWNKLIEWNQMIDTLNWEGFVEDMLRGHYDPTYSKSIKLNYRQIERSLCLPDLSPTSIDNALGELLPTPVAVS